MNFVSSSVFSPAAPVDSDWLHVSFWTQLEIFFELIIYFLFFVLFCFCFCFLVGWSRFFCFCFYVVFFFLSFLFIKQRVTARLSRTAHRKKKVQGLISLDWHCALVLPCSLMVAPMVAISRWILLPITAFAVNIFVGKNLWTDKNWNSRTYCAGHVENNINILIDSTEIKKSH